MAFITTAKLNQLKSQHFFNNVKIIRCIEIIIYSVAIMEEKKKSLFFRLGMYGKSINVLGNQKFVSRVPLPESNSQKLKEERSIE